VRMLDDLKILENGGFEGYGKSTTGLIKVVFWNSLMKSVDISYVAPQAHGIINVALHREYS
jgi:hypothetical protein